VLVDECQRRPAVEWRIATGLVLIRAELGELPFEIPNVCVSIDWCARMSAVRCRTQRGTQGDIVGIPEVGGLHTRYERRAG
jgi:hypothetical protein